MNLAVSNILVDLDEVIKLAEQAFTFERIFDLTGISDILRSMYIETNHLSKDYVEIIFNSVKKFIKQPLYKNLDLNNEKDLKFLRTNRDFNSAVKNNIQKIKDRLIPRQSRVLEYLSKFESGEHIPVKDILKETKLDLASVLFILDDLKKTSKIYDYNGREVVLI